MTGSTHIKQAIIAALCEHPEQEKYRARAFKDDNLTAMTEALAGKGVALTKKDFFTPDENGVYLIDTAGFWRNFDRIRDMLAKQGERFEADDFLFTLNAGSRRLLMNSAIDHKSLDKVFSEQIWRGRFEEMELLWYKVAVPARRDFAGTDGTLPLPLKRRLLAAEGRVPPEDRLLRAGLTPAEVRDAFREQGNFDAVKRRLANAGDRLRKEYVLLCDHVGDTCFYAQESWQRYPEIARTLAANGEQLEVADFIRQVGQVGNILTRAAERRALDKVFAPELWANRLGDMLTLWGHVREGWKSQSLPDADFDVAYAKAESLTYAPLVNFTNLHGKQDLIRALNEGDAQPVLPLALKAFWDDHASAAVPALKLKGEPLQLVDLRRVSGQMGHSCLVSAAKFGHFRTVVDIVRVSGEEMKLEDFMLRDSHGNTLLSILAARKELPLVFTPDLWAGRVGDMKTLWNQVKYNDRSQIDMAKVEVATKQATLKKQSKGNLKIKK